jgi:hypothetical protein
MKKLPEEEEEEEELRDLSARTIDWSDQCLRLFTDDSSSSRSHEGTAGTNTCLVWRILKKTPSRKTKGWYPNNTRVLTTHLLFPNLWDS